MWKICLFLCLFVDSVYTQGDEEHVCIDHGIDGYSCKQLLNFYGKRDKLCFKHGYHCCETCTNKKKCKEDTGLETADRSYTCEELKVIYGLAGTCRLFLKNCCLTCRT